MAELDLANYRNRHSLASKVKRLLWNVVWLLLFRPTPQRGFMVFNVWRIFLLRLFGAKVGAKCVVMSSVMVWQPWNLELGDWVALSENVNCYSVDKIIIGSSTTISRDAFICTASHDAASRTMELVSAPIVIGDNCWVGARAFVCPGRRIGDGGVVGACSVVTHDVEPWTIVAGNPAKCIKRRELKNA